MFFVWLFFYGTVMLISRQLAFLTPWAAPAGLLLAVLPLVGWLLCSPQGFLLHVKQLPFSQWKRRLFFIPYLLPAVYPLIRFGPPGHSPADILCIFLAATLEELVFRVLLLQTFRRQRPAWGMLLSSAAFAAAHALNLTGGAAPVYVLFQILYAFVIGFVLSELCLSCKNVLPCIGIHFGINLTASSLLQPADPLFWLCVCPCLACAIGNIFLKRKNTLRHKEVSL